MHTHNSDWYPPPTALHIVDEHQTNSQQSVPSSGYPINRQRYGSMPRSASHSASTPPRPIKYATHSYGQHSRSTTSPEAQQGNQTQPPLLRGYSTSALHSEYPMHGQPISHDGRSHTLNRNLSSYPSVKHPYPASVSHPHKGADSRYSSYRNAQDLRGQGSQPDSMSFDTQSMGYYPYDTMSEHNLSDSTQNSDMSEPTYQRPKYVLCMISLLMTPHLLIVSTPE